MLRDESGSCPVRWGGVSGGGVVRGREGCPQSGYAEWLHLRHSGGVERAERTAAAPGHSGAACAVRETMHMDMPLQPASCMHQLRTHMHV